MLFKFIYTDPPSTLCFLSATDTESQSKIKEWSAKGREGRWISNIPFPPKGPTSRMRLPDMWYILTENKTKQSRKRKPTLPLEKRYHIKTAQKKTRIAFAPKVIAGSIRYAGWKKRSYNCNEKRPDTRCRHAMKRRRKERIHRQGGKIKYKRTSARALFPFFHSGLIVVDLGSSWDPVQMAHMRIGTGVIVPLATNSAFHEGVKGEFVNCFSTHRNATQRRTKQCKKKCCHRDCSEEARTKIFPSTIG